VANDLLKVANDLLNVSNGLLNVANGFAFKHLKARMFLAKQHVN